MNTKTKQLLTEIIESLYEDCETFTDTKRVSDGLNDLIGIIDMEQCALYCRDTDILRTVCDCPECVEWRSPDTSEPFIS